MWVSSTALSSRAVIRLFRQDRLESLASFIQPPEERQCLRTAKLKKGGLAASLGLVEPGKRCSLITQQAVHIADHIKDQGIGGTILFRVSDRLFGHGELAHLGAAPRELSPPRRVLVLEGNHILECPARRGPVTAFNAHQPNKEVSFQKLGVIFEHQIAAIPRFLEIATHQGLISPAQEFGDIRLPHLSWGSACRFHSNSAGV